MNIAISPNLGKQNIFAAVSLICERLREFGAQINMADEHHSQFASLDAAFLPGSDLYSLCDIVVALGGDGTILRAARQAAVFGKPVLGINVGRLGFLAGLEMNELDQLSALFSGDYSIDPRMLLSVRVGERGEEYFALNDAVISKGEVSRIVDIDVLMNGSSLASYNADGVIVSTPTGSTAYALSAGGPVVDPSMHCLLIAPICPHSLFTRCVVIEDNASISVKAFCRFGNDVYVTVDGEQSIRLSPEEVVLVRKAPFSASLIRMKERAFYQTLREKLLDRR